MLKLPSHRLPVRLGQIGQPVDQRGFGHNNATATRCRVRNPRRANCFQYAMSSGSKCAQTGCHVRPPASTRNKADVFTFIVGFVFPIRCNFSKNDGYGCIQHPVGYNIRMVVGSDVHERLASCPLTRPAIVENKPPLTLFPNRLADKRRFYQ